MSISVNGFAVFDSERREIFANTVHTSKQQAMVNGLVVLYGFITPQNWQYPAVRAKWLSETTGSKFTIVEVTVITKGTEISL